MLNGPIRLEIGASGSFNALGNSDRATAVIGRALRLALINIMDVRPGAIDRSTLGHPGKFTFCVAEDEEDSTWLSLAEQRGMPKEVSAVTVMAAGAPRQIMNEWTTKPVVRDRGDSIYPALESVGHLLVVGAGGPAGGFGAVIPPWLGNKSHAVTMAIGACVDCEPPRG